MRALAWSAILAFAAAIVGACGGGSGGNGQAVASCQGIEELESYRYKIAIKFESPAFQATPGATPGQPLTAFAATLSALLSDFVIDGAHIAPDRTQAILRFQEDEIEIRAIGDRSWVSVSGGFEEQTSSEDAALLTPSVVCTDIVQEIAQSLAGVDSEDETINGVEAKRYTVSDADLERLPNLLGAGEETQLPKNFQVDVWLAKEGRWPVQLNIAARDTDAQGRAIGLTLLMAMRDINDAGIRIEPPVASAGS